jgi:hypothetical protein
MLDKLAKRNIIHKNKAANQKSKLAKAVSKIGTNPIPEKKVVRKKAAVKKVSK